MESFWDYSVWGTWLIIGVLLASLLIANMLKKGIPFLQVPLHDSQCRGEAG